ncbi:MAG: hypothetical protein H6747_01805 [Deltaproteobacteria bacterium]|nr:hypothetical protein [Deltaproteobacteria bacterium]
MLADSRLSRAAIVVSTLAVATLVSATLMAPQIFAAAPGRTVVEGVLSASGGPAADGEYALSFAVYDGKEAQSAALTVPVAKVAVVGGRFAATLPLDAAAAAKLAALADPWLGVTVGSDPELPRQAMGAAPYALVAGSVGCVGCVGGDTLANGSIAAAKLGFNYAGSSTKGGAALDLACTGCVGVSEMKFDGDVDLGGNSIKAKNATLSGDVVAKTVTATAFIGDGSKLTGLALPSGTCPAGQVVTGIATDGKLTCKSVADALPKDGLDEVSNGLLKNQFVETVASAGAVAIPDNTGATATSILTAPSYGTVQGLTVKVKLENTDLSTVSIKLLPPDDKKVGYVLCDPCGDKDSKALDASWSDAKAPKSGDLAAWIGKDVAGTWNLVVNDASFCIKQAAGNDALCDLDNKTDGAITSWSLEFATLSSKKVQLGGALLFHVSETEPIPCTTATFGATYANPKDKAVYVCNGKDYAAIYLTIPGSKENPVSSCKDLQTKVPEAKSGNYWIANNGNPVELYCDMVTEGGGWTVLFDETKVACGQNWADWSDNKGTDATVAGQCTRVHGVWGSGGGGDRTISTYGVPHAALRVFGRYYAVDSWDNESNGARLLIDGGQKWSANKVWNAPGQGNGWVTASFSPAPWGNNATNGYWQLENATGAISHTGVSVKVEVRTGIDQDLSDESFAFSHMKVMIR